MESEKEIGGVDRETVGQEKERMGKGILEEKKRGMKTGKEGSKGAERRGSTGNIEEMWKRKRELIEGLGGGKGEEELGVLKKGKKEQKLQQIGLEERVGGEMSWWKKMKEEWKNEMKEGIQEVKEMLKEEFRRIYMGNERWERW